MPDKKSEGEAPEEKSSGGSKQMITTALLAVILVGVGYVVGGMLGGGSSDEPTPDAAAEVEEDETPHVGHVVDLAAINVNLADSRYLRVAVSLGLDEHYEAGGGGHGGGEVEFSVAAASDVLLRTFTGKTIAELSTEEGREAARVEMLEALEPHYGHDVVAIYFTEFVMQ